MHFNIDIINTNYARSKGWREIAKWAFTVGTFGLGGLYLWGATSIIKEGQIGLRRNYRGEMILLPPGRHSNFPWESYAAEPQSLSQKDIKLGPYTIITVETGYIAKSFDKGVLHILKTGQHLLAHAAHVFKGFVSIKEEIKEVKIDKISTKDNVNLALQANVQYQITDPETAINKIENIDTTITEITQMCISGIVSNVNLAQITQANDGLSQCDKSKIAEDLKKQVTGRLSLLGINVLDIGITDLSVNDEELAHELAQGAVKQSQTQSRRLTAEGDAEVKRISAEAKANAKIMKAEAKAKATAILTAGRIKALEAEGEAVTRIVEKFGNNNGMHDVFKQLLQADLVQGAKNPHLFFMQSAAGAPIPVLPIQSTPSCSSV